MRLYAQLRICAGIFNTFLFILYIREYLNGSKMAAIYRLTFLRRAGRWVLLETVDFVIASVFCFVTVLCTLMQTRIKIHSIFGIRLLVRKAAINMWSSEYTYRAFGVFLSAALGMDRLRSRFAWCRNTCFVSGPLH